MVDILVYVVFLIVFGNGRAGGPLRRGVAKGELQHADPLVFYVSPDDQKLYLFCGEDAKTEWEASEEAKRALADENWPELCSPEHGVNTGAKPTSPVA